MRSSGFVVFIFWLLLQGESFLASGDREIYLPQELSIEDQCSEYCFSVVKLFFDHFIRSKVASDANGDLKNKIYLLETQLKNKDEEIKMKNQQIAAKDEQIKREQFEAKINSSEAEIIKLNATIEKNELKSSRIIDLETQIKEYQRQLTNKTEDIKAFTVRIKLLETETNKSRDELISTKEEIEKCHAKIKDQEVEIKHGQDQLAIKAGLIKAFESTVREKESQFKNLTSETELLRGKYEASSCLPFVNSTNVHSIRLFDTDPFIVHCCSNVSGSGWTLIQRRVNANENFNRSWADYKMGFGDLRENFFLGLEKIHRMTLLQPHELYIQLKDVNGSTRYARYDDFKIGNEEEAYELISLGKYSGTAGDSLTKFQLNMKFSTLDRDNDANVKRNCAKMFGGGWWFSACGRSHLNGNYYKDGTCEVRDGIIWATWKDYDFTISLTFSQMMIRQKNAIECTFKLNI